MKSGALMRYAAAATLSLMMLATRRRRDMPPHASATRAFAMPQKRSRLSYMLARTRFFALYTRMKATRVAACLLRHVMPLDAACAALRAQRAELRRCLRRYVTPCRHAHAA